MFSQAAMQSMTQNMQGLKQAAESGSFAIDQAGADAYIKAIEAAQDELQGVELEALALVQETKLGTSPDGKAMSRYNHEGAVGGAGTVGIIPVIDQLKTALEDARLAMQRAVQNYRAVDDTNKNAFKGL
jgi:citrate lyase beta subunit